MAITGTKLFVAAEVLTADDVNTFLSRGVHVFADSATRTAAYGGAGEPTLAEGEASYLLDTNVTSVWDGAAWTAIGGYTSGELSRATTTAPLTVTAFDSAGSLPFVSLGAYTFDGSTSVDLEAYCPRIQPAANDFITSELWDGAALAILNVTGMAGGGGTGAGGLVGSIRLTPSAGAHTFVWRVYRSGSNGTMQAGTGAAGGYAPASLRIVRA